MVDKKAPAFLSLYKMTKMTDIAIWVYAVCMKDIQMGLIFKQTKKWYKCVVKSFKIVFTLKINTVYIFIAH